MAGLRTSPRSLSTKTGIITVRLCSGHCIAPNLILVDIVYSVSPVGDNASGGAVIEFRDVTEEKRIERERMDALLMNEQQSIRIKESEVHKANMTSFVSFVCHELRNPLQGVTSSAVGRPKVLFCS